MQDKLTKLIDFSIEILETEGWIQGSFYQAGRGFCMEGAINAAIANSQAEFYQEDIDVLTKALAEVGAQHHVSSVVAMNDEVCQSKEDAVLYLKQTKEALENG